MLTDLNFLQTNVEQDSLTLESEVIECVVDYAFDCCNLSMKKVNENVRGNRKKKSRFSTNPFDCDNAENVTSVEMESDLSTKRKSLNPFDEDYCSCDETTEASTTHEVSVMSASSDICDKAKPVMPTPKVSSDRRSCPCCVSSMKQRSCPRIHKGFFYAYLSVRLEMFIAIIEGIIHCVNMIVTKEINDEFCFNDMPTDKQSSLPALDFHICGHSLGEFDTLHCDLVLICQCSRWSSCHFGFT